MNGTLREPVKVQRGWKSPKLAIVEGKRINYNIVKPHQALENNYNATHGRRVNNVLQIGAISWTT